MAGRLEIAAAIIGECDCVFEDDGLKRKWYTGYPFAGGDDEQPT